jgi:hypothetical protein
MRTNGVQTVNVKIKADEHFFSQLSAVLFAVEY